MYSSVFDVDYHSCTNEVASLNDSDKKWSRDSHEIIL